MSAPATQIAWVDEVRTAVAELLAHPDAHPACSPGVHADAARAGDAALARLDREVAELTELIDRGRQELAEPDALSRATADGLAGAVYELVSMRLVRGDGSDLPELLPSLMFSLTLPYLGRDAALAEFHLAR